MNDMAFWVSMLVVGILALFVLLWIAIDTIVQNRKKKHAKKMAEEYERERAARKSDPEIGQEEPIYVSHFGITKEVLEYIQLIQLKTHAGSVGETVCDALRFYAEIVNMFEPGDRLLFQKSSEEWCTHFKFKPLERVEKKIES